MSRLSSCRHFLSQGCVALEMCTLQLCIFYFMKSICIYLPFTPMHLENKMILKKIKSKLFCCAEKKVKVFLATPIFRLIMTNLHRRVTVGERTSCRAISSLPAHGVRLGLHQMIYALDARDTLQKHGAVLFVLAFLNRFSI